MTTRTDAVGAAVLTQKFIFNDQELVVGPKCDDNAGYWICVTHGESFPNNLSKDGHIASGTHVLAWGCYTHGPEVP